MNTLRNLLVFGVMAVFTMIANAETRTFTSKDGSKKITAEPVSHKAGIVKLKMAGDKVIEVSPSVFSVDDQVFLGNWMLKTPETVNYSFRIDAKREKVSGTRQNLGYKLVKNEKWAYRVKLTNSSRDVAEGLVVKYKLFTSNEADGSYSSSKTSQAPHLGTMKSPGPLKFNQTLDFLTNTVQIDTVDYDGGGSRYQDQLKGMLLRVENPKGEVVFDWVTPTTFMSGKTWENTEKGKGKGSTAKIR